MTDIPLILFTKAPVPGQVKTRLQTHCSAEQAAHIATLLLQESVAKASAYWPGKVILSVWLQTDHPVFEQLSQQYEIEVVQQADGDLGQKMHDAMQNHGYPAAIIGCDTPHISRSILQHAHAELTGGRDVLGPSEDGGYYLLGLLSPAAELFTGVDWGTDKVLRQTLLHAKKQRLAFTMLDSLNDIDTWQDAKKAAPLVPPLDQYLAKITASDGEH